VLSNVLIVRFLIFLLSESFSIQVYACQLPVILVTVLFCDSIPVLARGEDFDNNWPAR
jgi:hypothetical protein